MKHKIITISREFGSGGRTIGKKLADNLGVKCYDREIIEEVASQSGFSENYISEKGEYGPKGKLSKAFASRGYYNGLTNEDYIWTIQSRFIRELAEKEACVIVGRCADYVLRERGDVLRVFIHSDIGSRAERIVKVYGESDIAPEKRLRDKDKRRAAYYQFYTEMKWGESRNYHLCLDSGALGIDQCVEILSQI